MASSDVGAVEIVGRAVGEVFVIVDNVTLLDGEQSSRLDGPGDRSAVTVRRSADRWEILRCHIQDGVPLTHLALQTGVCGGCGSMSTRQRWTMSFRTPWVA